jgi:hypothetical protein
VSLGERKACGALDEQLYCRIDMTRTGARNKRLEYLVSYKRAEKHSDENENSVSAVPFEEKKNHTAHYPDLTVVAKRCQKWENDVKKRASERILYPIKDRKVDVLNKFHCVPPVM